MTETAQARARLGRVALPATGAAFMMFMTVLGVAQASRSVPHLLGETARAQVVATEPGSCFGGRWSSYACRQPVVLVPDPDGPVRVQLVSGPSANVNTTDDLASERIKVSWPAESPEGARAFEEVLWSLVVAGTCLSFPVVFGTSRLRTWRRKVRARKRNLAL